MDDKKKNVFECSAVVKWIEIELTSYCWMNCIVCPRNEIQDNTFLSINNFKEIVFLLKEWNYSEVMVCWLGDAFIHPDINYFMEYLFDNIPTINLFFMTKWLAIKDYHLEKILELKSKWFNVSLTFSVFSLNEKIYNYLTWWDFFKNFLDILNKSENLKINYSMEFMLSTLTLNEIDKFKSFAHKLNKDYWISLVHNWWWKIHNKVHSKLFNEGKLNWYYHKRDKFSICEVMKYDYLYIDSKWKVFQCSLNSLNNDWYLWKLWDYSLNWFLSLKSNLLYDKICSNCFYYNYKTFN